MFEIGDIVQISMQKFSEKTDRRAAPKSALADYNGTICQIVEKNGFSFKLQPVEPVKSKYGNPPLQNFSWPDDAFEYPPPQVEKEEFEDILFAG